MSILNQLSSQTGDRTEYSNRKVVVQCLENPGLLEEIIAGLTKKDAALVGDCAEVLTQVAEDHPDWVAPSVGELALLLDHKNTRVRWEAMHALALVATLIPETIRSILPQLREILHRDRSVIVRDHATDAVASYASTGESAAQAAFPILKEMLTLWEAKQAGHALLGLVQVAYRLPAAQAELRQIADDYASFPRPVVRKAAKALEKAVNR
jgi:hypothetical protein